MRYGTKVIVKKTRDLYLHKHTRIHLDTVADLGMFIELETVIHEELNDAEHTEEHAEMKSLLSLDQYPTIAGSYSDLIENKNRKNRVKKWGHRLIKNPVVK